MIYWTCLFVLVLRAMLLQDRRELAAEVPQTNADMTRTFAAFTEALRAATRRCVVAMLAAGDSTNESARLAVIQALRSSGMEQYDNDWLVHDLKANETSQITSYLAPLEQSLNQQGKETLCGQVAAVGFADGTLTTAQVQVLETMRAALDLSDDDLRRVLPT